MKKNLKEYIIWLIFGLLGLIFLVIGVFISFNTFNYSNKVDISGVISRIETKRDSDGDTDLDVYVSYRVNGTSYESRLNGYSSSYYEGKTIEIYYDKDDPNKIGNKSLDLVFLVFPGIGLIFFLIGGTGLFLKAKRGSQTKKLKINGTVVYATYTETVYNSSYQVNGRSPYNIICEWNNPTDGNKYIFKSDNIWVNPENIIKEKNIETIPVYIDPNNLKKYYVDVDSILNDVVDLS